MDPNGRPALSKEAGLTRGFDNFPAGQDRLTSGDRMNRSKSYSRSRTYSVLLGTASFFAIGAQANAAEVPAAAAAPAEEILVTGSLIRGAPAIGVPVTTLGAEAYQETGSFTTTEMLRTVPALDVRTTVSPLAGGGNISFGQNVSIHGFNGSGGDPKTLLLINGHRWPIQGHGGDTIDPSIVPQLAVQRVDILTAGASAVYGADAVTGVINVIMKRGFDGAITQGSFSISPEIGGLSVRGAQQWGRSWDTGNITLTAEVLKQNAIKASKRDYYTTNFEPYGLMDTTPLGNSNPAVVSIGGPSFPTAVQLGVPVVDTTLGGIPPNTRNQAEYGTRFCSNCFAVPHGAGMDYVAGSGLLTAAQRSAQQLPTQATTTWTAMVANQFVVGQRNEQNQRDPYQDSDLQPAMDKSAFAGTFNQMLTEDFFGLGSVELEGTGFWSNRRAQAHYPGTAGSGNTREHVSLARGGRGFTVPTINPYFPTGAPANILVHYNFSPELGGGARITGAEIASRAEFALRFDELPFGWRGDVFYSFTDDNNFAHTSNMINVNAARAALGNTIASVASTDTQPGFAAYVKPSSIPFLNVFCDASVYVCNSQQTLNYITGYRNQDESWKIRQTGANFSGPIFDLPAGPIQGALSVELTSQHYVFSDEDNVRGNSKAVIGKAVNVGKRVAHAFFGQLNVPLVGGDMSFPGMQALNLELGYRLDHFDFQSGYVKTPKIAANWDVGAGLVLRGAWGKSFRAPAFGQTSEVSGSRVIYASTQPSALCGGGFEAGSAAALLCRGSTGTTVFNGADIQGGSGIAAPVRGVPLRSDVPRGLKPETAKQFMIGGNFSPTADGPFGFLSGLNIDMTYFDIKIDDEIRADTTAAGNINLAAARRQYLVIPRPDLPFTAPENAEFRAILDELSGFLRWEIPTADVASIKWIRDNANTNLGSAQLQGIDFDWRYDWDTGEYGQWNIGATGYYEVDRREQPTSDSPSVSLYDDAENDQRGHGARLQRVRYRLGWTDGTWNASLFANYKGHTTDSGGANLNLPNCYWAPGFGPGSCYAGSPYYAQVPGSPSVYYDGAPSHVEFDLNVGYNTGETPANPYLQNMTFTLNVANVLDRKPPFQFASRGQAREIRAYDNRWNELQRTVSVTVTKNW